MGPIIGKGFKNTKNIGVNLTYTYPRGDIVIMSLFLFLQPLIIYQENNIDNNRYILLHFLRHLEFYKEIRIERKNEVFFFFYSKTFARDESAS